MKVAVCISGQPRGYKTAYEYVKRNLLDKYDCDVFIHTWENEVYNPYSVIDLYNPVSYAIGKPLMGKYNSKYTNTPDAAKWPPKSTVSAYYSIFQTSLLRTHYEIAHQPYDWVVKTRFDYALNTTLPLNTLDPKRLYVPDCRQVPTRDFGNDQFAFSSSEIMTFYMSTYMHLDFLYRSGIQMIGEDMLWANLKRFGIVGELVQYVNMNNPFPPGAYNGTPHSLVRDDMNLWSRNL